MKIAHVTIQTDKFDEEVRFYEEQTELKVQRDMRPAGRNMVFLADASRRYLHRDNREQGRRRFRQSELFDRLPYRRCGRKTRGSCSGRV